MPTRIVFSSKAVDDLADIRAWYSQPGAGERAKRRVLRIIEGVRDLSDTAEVWPRGSDRRMRERIVEGHVIIYRSVSRTDRAQERTDRLIEIVRVLGPGRSRDS